MTICGCYTDQQWILQYEGCCLLHLIYLFLKASYFNTGHTLSGPTEIPIQNYISICSPCISCQTLNLHVVCFVHISYIRLFCVLHVCLIAIVWTNITPEYYNSWHPPQSHYTITGSTSKPPCWPPQGVPILKLLVCPSWGLNPRPPKLSSSRCSNCLAAMLVKTTCTLTAVPLRHNWIPLLVSLTGHSKHTIIFSSYDGLTLHYNILLQHT